MKYFPYSVSQIFSRKKSLLHTIFLFLNFFFFHCLHMNKKFSFKDGRWKRILRNSCKTLFPTSSQIKPRRENYFSWLNQPIVNQLIVSVLTYWFIIVLKGTVTTELSTSSLPAQGRVFLYFTSTTPTWLHQSPGRSFWLPPAPTACVARPTTPSLLPWSWRSAISTTSSREALMACTLFLLPTVSPSAPLTRTGRPSKLFATATISSSSPVLDRVTSTPASGHGTTTTPATGWTAVTMRRPCKRRWTRGRRWSPSRLLTNGMKGRR